jgi:hypothetical protein
MWQLHTNNADHWVKIDQVASFKRMEEFKSHGRDWLVTALRYSTELEVNSEGVQLRRRNEVKEPKGQFERSVYAVRPLFVHPPPDSSLSTERLSQNRNPPAAETAREVLLEVRQR